MAVRMNYSFLKGCLKVPKERYKEVQLKLQAFLGCKTPQHYYKKRKSFPDIPAHIKSGIENIFSEYGIDPADIWTITPIENEAGEIN